MGLSGRRSLPTEYSTQLPWRCFHGLLLTLRRFHRETHVRLMSPNVSVERMAAGGDCSPIRALWGRRHRSPLRSSRMRVERAKLKCRGDDMTVAQGKRSAALGHRAKTISSFFPSGWARRSMCLAERGWPSRSGPEGPTGHEGPGKPTRCGWASRAPLNTYAPEARPTGREKRGWVRWSFTQGGGLGGLALGYHQDPHADAHGEHPLFYSTPSGVTVYAKRRHGRGPWAVGVSLVMFSP